jgi:hypothetical protein
MSKVKSKIPTRKALTQAQSGARREIREVLQRGADDIRRELVRSADADRSIPADRREQVLINVGNIIMRMFVGEDGYRAYGDENGAEALAPYPRVLSKWLFEVQAQVVLAHAAYAKRQLARYPEIIQWLETYRSPRLFETTVENPIFYPNPLAQYEPAHKWVDPKGYTLSKRIWQVGVRTREKIDRVVDTAIREGWSSMRLAEAVEAYLLPGRTGIRTNRPYDLDASFDAMRLARTEIGRAHTEASRLAALANPYVEGLDWALSLQHPRVDICDQHATIGMNGGRLKPAYPKDNAKLPFYDSHPLCLCYILSYVAESPAAVTAQLRETYEREKANMAPVNVVAARFLLVDMFGRTVFNMFIG